MSEAQRYSFYPVLVHHIDGPDTAEIEFRRENDGLFVRYDDYARLKAEVERLNERNKFLEQIDSYLQGANESTYEKRCDELEAEVERSTAWGRGLESDLSHARVEISFLKAEVERLRDAGDGLDDALETYFELLPTLINEMQAKAMLKARKASRAWNAAKEGKPSV